MSDRIAVLNHGRIAQVAGPEEIYNYPADAFVADFIGEAALVPVERVRRPRRAARGEAAAVRASGATTRKDLVLVVRSEKLRLARRTADRERDSRSTVRSRIFQGESQLLLVELGGGMALTFRLSHACRNRRAAAAARAAEPILSLHPEHAFVVPRGRRRAWAAAGRWRSMRMPSDSGRKRRCSSLLPGLLLVGALLLLPLLWLLALSFYDDGLSLAHYARLFDDPSYSKSFLLTFQIAGAVTLAAVLLGYPLCYWMLGLRSYLAARGARLRADPVLDQPAGAAPTPGSCSCSGAASSTRLCRTSACSTSRSPSCTTPPGTTIGMAHILLPFLVLPLFATMQRIDRDLLKAAAALGGSPGFRVLARVLSALAAGADGGRAARLRAVDRLLRHAAAARAAAPP